MDVQIWGRGRAGIRIYPARRPGPAFRPQPFATLPATIHDLQSQRLFNFIHFPKLRGALFLSLFFVLSLIHRRLIF